MIIFESLSDLRIKVTREQFPLCIDRSGRRNLLHEVLCVVFMIHRIWRDFIESIDRPASADVTREAAHHALDEGKKIDLGFLPSPPSLEGGDNCVRQEVAFIAADTPGT